MRRNRYVKIDEVSKNLFFFNDKLVVFFMFSQHSLLEKFTWLVTENTRIVQENFPILCV
jgi:hypothetical protein